MIIFLTTLAVAILAVLAVLVWLCAQILSRLGVKQSDDARQQTTVDQLTTSVSEIKSGLEAIRAKQDVLEQQFMPRLLELQEVKTTVQHATSIGTDLKGELAAIERRIQERLETVAKETQARDQADHNILDAIANVLARTVRKGRAGEDIVRETLRALQPMYVVANQQLAGGIVEFAIKLTEHRVIPLDSKWVASDLLDQHAAESDERRREDLRKAIEDRVLKHAQVVAKYIDTTTTTDLAVCAIPDAAYEVLTKAVSQAYGQGVLIVPYSQVLPLVLSLLHVFRRYTGSIDLEALKNRLAQIRMDVGEMQIVLDNNLQKGSTMIQNAISAYRELISAVRASVGAMERSDSEPNVTAPPPMVAVTE